MEITLKLLKPLKDAIGKDSLTLEVDEGTVISLLEQVSKEYPELGKELLDDKGGLDYRVNVILNDKPLNELDVEVNDGDQVTLFIPVSGG
jgi:MoaD family protein